MDSEVGTSKGGKSKKNKICSCRPKRNDIIGGGIQDKIIQCPWEDVNVVLRDWGKIMKNYKKLSVKVFLYYFNEHPSYKYLFSSLVNVDDEDLVRNKSFLIHSYAVMKGIDSVINTLSGNSEEENQLLPFVGRLHYKRGITLSIMQHFREALLFVCCDFLKSTLKEKVSWEVVLDNIFKNYLCKDYELLDKKFKINVDQNKTVNEKAGNAQN